MLDFKLLSQTLDPSARPHDVDSLARPTGNIYQSLAIIARRANQISRQMKDELHSKLEEFSLTNESLDEVQENKEQIEISRFYERLPNPVVIAMQEFKDGKLIYRFQEDRVPEDI